MPFFDESLPSLTSAPQCECSRTTFLARSENLKNIFRHRPVIAAVRSDDDLAFAMQSDAPVVALMGGHILQLPELVRRLHETGRTVFIHPELIHGLGKDPAGIDGLGKDPAGIDYLADLVLPDGIVSTKKALLQKAHERGLLSVFQFFAIDTQAVISALDNAKSIAPDFIEMMPGLLFTQIGQIASITRIPVIAAGLIKKESEIQEVLAAGAVALSSSTKALWSHQIVEVSDAER